ncbi:hypothetical protein FQN50_009607 [Emmonsiellopsis sp. PD_5]|nr:hypothetical protein FQN50_009607 [Emmonsiellopsis sp. PD_5]
MDDKVMHALNTFNVVTLALVASWSCYIRQAIWTHEDIRQGQLYPNSPHSISPHSIFEVNERAVDAHVFKTSLSWWLVISHALYWVSGAITLSCRSRSIPLAVFYFLLALVHQVPMFWVAYQLHQRRKELRAMPRVFMCRLCVGRTGVRDHDRMRAGQGPNPDIAKAINEDFMKDFPEAMTKDGYMDMSKATKLFHQGREVKHTAGGLCNMHFAEVAGPKMRDVHIEKVAWLKLWFMDEKDVMDVMGRVEKGLEGDEPLKQETEMV